MNKTLNIIVWPIILVPPVYLAISWNKLQERIPVHFDINGNADRYGNKKELLITVIILTTLSIIINLIFKNIHRIDPKKNAVENKDRLFRIGFAVTVFMTAVTCTIIYSGMHGASGFNASLVLSGVGLLLAFIGNYMLNIKPNYFAGFRLPWTLEDPDNWKKTHALGGKLLFTGGILLATLCLILSPKTAFIVFFSVVGIVTIIPCIYSYRIYKKKKKGSNQV